MKIIFITVLLLTVALSTQDNGSSNNNVVFTNGGCTYVNGVIYWNGTSRPANDNDRKLIKEYQNAYEEYQKQFQNNLSNFLSNIFGGLFGNGDNNLEVPNPPTAPCFCAKEKKQVCSST